MATQLQMRRGTASQNSSFTGAEGEVSVNTTNDSLHIHDGSTAGGFELARVDGSNWAITNAISTTANISFGDNDKAIFGAGSDLQIYHDGSHSYISDQGTGDLRILAADFRIRNAADDETMIQANSDADVSLWYNNSKKLATTNTGIDVTGTVTASSASDALVRVSDSTNANQRLDLTHNAGVASIISGNNGAFGTLKLQAYNGTDTIDRFRISSNGDISFYEDTGTTPKLFWDSSAESLGIRTTAPERTLHVDSGGVQVGALISSTSTLSARLSLMDANTTNSARVGIGATGDNLGLYAGGAARATIDSSGNVGIGCTPSRNLDIQGTGDTLVSIVSPAANQAALFFGDTDSDSVGRVAYDNSDNSMRFNTNGSEAMRIDSSGNVGIGTSSPDSLLTIDKDVSTAYSSTDDSAQRSNTNTLLLKNEDGTANSFAQIAFDLAGANQSIARIVGINDGTSTSALAFVTEGNNTKREAMRLDGSGHITSLPTYNNGSASSANMVVNSNGLFLRSVSSAKYKTNIEDVQDAYVDSLLNIRPVYYRSTLENDNTEHSHWGFIAEEVAEIDPRLVHYKTVDISYSDDGERVETELETPEPEGVQYDRFAPLMLKLIQKQQATITALEARITQLENN